MKKYRIEVEEILTRIVEVDAYNIADAIDKVYERYHNEEIVLDYQDWCDTKYYLLDEYNNRISKL